MTSLERVKKNLPQAVNDVLINEFEIDPAKLTPNARFYEDLGLDSLDAVDMIVHLENKMGMRVSFEQFADVRTLSDLLAAVEKTSTLSSLAEAKE